VYLRLRRSDETDFTSRAHASIETLTPRVNGDLNSTVTPKAPPAGMLEIRFTVSQEAPFPARGGTRAPNVTAP